MLNDECLSRAVGRAALSALLGALCAGAARASDWPQFHGPRRDNRSDEAGLLKSWPPEGPRLLWTAKGIGHGFACVAVADGLVYVTGNVGGDTLITALGLDGKVAWTARNGPAYRREHPGTRSTPTIDGARLYHENAEGDIVCLEAKTGKPVWSLNLLQRFQGRNITWGLAESLLVDGDRLIAVPGGEEIGVVALHKLTGETVWTARGIGEKPGYSSPIVVEHQGLRQVVALMAKALVGIHADTGELLWRFTHETPFDESIFTPLALDGHLYFATAHARGSRLLKLNVAGQKCSVEVAWSSDKLDSHQGGVVLHDGYAYGFCHGNYKPRWDCLELKTGKLMCSERTPTDGCVTYADGMIYGMDERGTVMLIRPTPEKREVVSQFAIPQGGAGPTWAHPVVCGGRLYLRHSDSLFAYDIKKEQPKEDR